MSDGVTIDVESSINPDELRELYSSVGWGAYTADVPGLHRAVENSDHVVTARHGSLLVGLARVLSDDVSIAYVQDILVRPDYQHQGIGTRLLQECLDRYAHVRSKVLMTDDLEMQHSFYRSMGFADTCDIETVALHTFVQMRGVTPDPIAENR